MMFIESKSPQKKGHLFTMVLAGVALVGSVQASHAQNPAFFGRESTLPYATKDAIIADINQDGRPDIISIRDYIGEVMAVSVSTGNGDGTFADPIVVDSDTYGIALAVADVNHDGTPDIIVGHRFSIHDATHPYDYITILRNAADGSGPFSFYAPVVVQMNGITALTVADMDGDGNPDIVFTAIGPNRLGVLYGDGDGSFSTQVSTTLNFQPGTVGVGNLRGNGRPDIVVNDVTNYRMQIVLNSANNHLTVGTSYPNHFNEDDIVLADMDGDGKLDLITADNYINNTTSSTEDVIIYHGNGDGTFNITPTSYTINDIISHIGTADLNGDGKPDLLIMQYSNGAVITLTNQGNLHFAAQSYPSGSFTAQTRFADVNGDGKPDLVTIEEFSETLAVLTGNGDGTFNSQKQVGNPGGHEGAALGDVNHDGILDLVYTEDTTKSINICLGRGDSSFAPPITYYYNNVPTGLALADVDHDGNLDILFTSDLPSGGNSGTIATMLGYGNGGFMQADFRNVGTPVLLFAVGDINKDGYPDVVLRDPFSTLVTVFGNGTSSFGTVSNVNVGGSPTSAAILDFNDGGYNYVAVTDFDNSLVRIYGYDPFHPTPTLTQVAQYSTGNAPQNLTVKDINGDGRPDLIYQNFNDHTIVAQYGGANHSFGAPVTLASGLALNVLTFGDMDGDGKPDLIYNRFGEGGIGIQYNLGGGTFGPVQKYAGDGGQMNLMTADLDGDGWNDLVAVGGNAPIVFHHISYGTGNVSGNLTLEGIDPGGFANDIALTFTPTTGGTSLIRHTLVKPDGNYTVSNLPKGNYFVRIKGVKYLAVDKAVNLTNSDATGFDAFLHVGDSNDDNSVDIADFGFFGGVYGYSINDGTGGYDPAADYNADGTVDIADFALLVANYSSMGDP